ncbi:2-oxoglutarate (2OG) and Fe(II)-dependent oxygenase superfamily protein [Rhynchospora pubera]|uniref:procollagen-proline 4-dioxygenase n=1 Tax=Rhynchospora pubera TaxID=906938 RepID=A0AAV8BQ93_9POAL|nr:2-oxoglutarate (2OG) and Fe(II)-dependent oxygenase superfamily protein [Rhynchospora pubera]
MSSRPLMRGIRPPRVYPKGRTSPYAIALTVLLVASALLLVLIALGVFSLPINSPSPSPKHERPRRARSAVQSSGDGLGEKGQQWTEVISWEPRAFIYHNFLSKEECEYLIELAKPHMVKSTVVDSTTGKSKDSRVRTSSGMFLQRGRDKVIRAIEKRIADYTFIPVEHGEGLQILHYEIGQKYEPHYDYFLDEFNTKNGGQRMATLLMYLSDVEEGGETIFPDAKVNSSSLPWHDELSECGKRGLGVKAKAGDALLFYSMKPDATLDPLSLHGGCPIIRGNKWSSTKWMHVQEYKA